MQTPETITRETQNPEEIQKLRDQVTVVIPTLNEAEAIGSLIDEIKSCGYDKVLVVDGHSTDETVKIAEKRGAQVIEQRGHGKAGAMITAFHSVPTPFLILMDGDGSYDPADLDLFLTFSNDHDFIKGKRTRNENMSWLHRLGNRIITRTFNLLFGTSIGDICSGMYFLRTSKVSSLTFEKHPLTVEQELAAQMALSTNRIATIPINYRKRVGGKSKTNTWRQGFRDLATNFDLARLYNPVLLFSFLSALAIVPSFALLFYALVLNYTYHDYHSGYFIGSAILLVLGAQGLTVATISAMLRRIERKLNGYGR